MKHNRSGYISFIVFAMLSMCMIIMSLYFSQVLVYRQLVTHLLKQDRLNRISYSSLGILQSILTPDTQDKKNVIPQPDAQAISQSPQQAALIKLLDFLNKCIIVQTDSLQAKFFVNIQSEQGKLNLNSLYDFEKKKFLYEGTAKDRKKICMWIFDTISKISKKPSLFTSFENFLKNRDFDVNGVTELLSIKEFNDVFNSELFLKINEEKESTNEKAYIALALTDIFTISTEQETINPWIFSPSWCTLLDLKPKQTMTEDEKKKFVSQITPSNNWDLDWNNKLKDFYQKDFKDIPSEIKTILTTEFEANIFSLLLKVNMAETNATIFTIIKMKAKDHLIEFEVLKSYQI